MVLSRLVRPDQQEVVAHVLSPDIGSVVQCRHAFALKESRRRDDFCPFFVSRKYKFGCDTTGGREERREAWLQYRPQPKTISRLNGSAIENKNGNKPTTGLPESNRTQLT